MKVNVNEIFCSIQGESLFSGRPCIFIRLCGCNLRCSYCDTHYAYIEGTPMTFETIFDQIGVYPYRLVEITGGEPLFQENTTLLIAQLIKKGYQVLLETNGSYDISDIHPKCIRIVDLKCPSSGEASKNRLANLDYLNLHDQLKFVIGNREDYEYAKTVINDKELIIPDHHILFSPIVESLNPATLAKWIIDDKLIIRFQLQLHKIIWPGIEKGV